ncbi:FAD:protein FMN transferase [Alicyclobacillus dauci]|uniref:FAD:protein FMN transferase n=1 Tax=Alicyclobacillus dauci TaxID=1475485 RepID=A0ABY6Z6F2_9BACL|nr:FAD:protein FMN transferase [Alicyclobacillus dauci]WAH37610.1 FAD:protein FMN transferase [Alicyclobacillus dauci]
MTKVWRKSALYMDTVVSVEIVTGDLDRQDAGLAINAALENFSVVEQACSRFDETSEVMRLIEHVGEPVQVSPVLFEAVRFALEVAKLTDGEFDPTVGHQLETYGFNRHYLTGHEVATHIASGESVTYRDVTVHEQNRTIQLDKPLVLDLGAIAKGLAIDMAGKSLAEFDGFVVNAGGDVLVHGVNEREEPWRVGIRRPDSASDVMHTLNISDGAVCTSGSYERKSPITVDTHHILRPAIGKSQNEVVSCTVVAPFAMLADALSTAAFVMGPGRGIELMERCDVDGILVTSSNEIQMTKQMKRYIDG